MAFSPFWLALSESLLMPPELTIHCSSRWLWKFNTLLQKGVRVTCTTQRSLMAVLEEDLHLDEDYIRRRIQTITLDNQPVDDPATALVPDGATLSISGAMPGLVGAILRTGGYYAAMRDSISCATCDTAGNVTHSGHITVKLFNLVLKDQAAAFLCRGFSASGSVLVPVLDELMALPDGPAVRLDPALDWASMRDSYLKAAWVHASVICDKTID